MSAEPAPVGDTPQSEWIPPMTSAGPHGTLRPVIAVLGPHWWAHGLALHERAVGAVPRGIEPDDAAEQLTRWRSGFQPADGGLAARLADAGLDEAGLLGLLAEPPEELTARIPRPEWVTTIE